MSRIKIDDMAQITTLSLEEQNGIRGGAFNIPIGGGYSLNFGYTIPALPGVPPVPTFLPSLNYTFPATPVRPAVTVPVVTPPGVRLEP
jgi:hypothetical protein